MPEVVTLTVDAINTKQQIIGMLGGMTDAVGMMDLRSDTDMVETLRGVTADCHQLLNLVRNLQAWAERTDEVTPPNTGLTELGGKMWRWVELTGDDEIPPTDGVNIPF